MVPSCSRFLRGASERQVPHPSRGGELFSKTIPNIELLEGPGTAVPLIMRAGDVSVHSSRSIHGSRPNRSARRRCGLTISYMPSGNSITQPGQPEYRGGWPGLYHLRGTVLPGINDGNNGSAKFLPWPTYVDGEDMPFRDAVPKWVLGTPRL